MTPFLSGNQIKLLRNGAEYFPALEAAIASAAHEIHLEAYIYQADVTGVRIGNALKHAAQRGVAVHVLLDGFGCKDLPKTFVEDLRQAGVQVIFYRQKISPWTLKKSRLRRLHRKIAVIDGNIGFVGGINIIDDYDIPSHTSRQIAPRIDYAVQLEGAIMRELTASANKLWRRIAWAHLLPAHASASKTTRQNIVKNGMQAALMLRDNVLHRRDIEEAYLSAITQASTEIIIANAYFLPGKQFRKALLEAVSRGVSVKLLLQGRMEYFLMFASQAFYGEFLKNGVEIYEYQKSFMHSKVAVIDCNWATVGSSNIDPFSLLLAREANVMVLNVAFATELRADILTTIQTGAHQISAHEWRHVNIFKRVASWLAYGAVRIILGIIGYGGEK